TAAETPWLQGKHTAFGKVISGMDIVDKISRVARDGDDVPLHQVIVEKIILR
ncbi:MAG: peptidylprolyl isomerase, partial [Patescibacteria group bacterium]